MSKDAADFIRQLTSKVGVEQRSVNFACDGKIPRLFDRSAVRPR
jgi:hypothetical protein